MPLPAPNPSQIVIAKARPATPQLVNLNMIVEVIRKHFGVQLKCIETPVYRKPYLDWIDRVMPLLKGFKVSNFTTFLKDDEKSTMEHISRFTAQCGEASQNKYYKLQMFLLSLIETVFTWYDIDCFYMVL